MVEVEVWTVLEEEEEEHAWLVGEVCSGRCTRSSVMKTLP
jgi:hypothetical protein